jgi:plasmid maintenance system antidote protein VapI
MSITDAAKALKISRVTLSKILNANSNINISADMTIRIERLVA